MAATTTEITAAQRYGVTSFDLQKKQRIIELSEPTVQALKAEDSKRELTAFCLGTNALHFNGANGLLVSEADALRIFRDAMGPAYKPDNSFERFVSDHRTYLHSPNTADLTLPEL